MIAVLFSGGIDSLCHLRWATNTFGRDNVVAVYYDVGQAYAERESRKAHILAVKCGVPFHKLSPMLLPEDPDTAQVEFRNLFLILWTAVKFPKCDGVVFGMLQGESPADKNPRFVRRLQAIISECRGTSVYGEARPFTIHTPFSRHTKAEMLRWYRTQWTDGLPYETVGCFQPLEPMCGRCWCCINRWIAFQENGLRLEDYLTHPAEGLLARVRGLLADPSHRERRGAGRLWARRRWLREAFRQVDRYCWQVHGRGALWCVRHIT